MNLAGHEDYKEICEDTRLEDRAPWALIVPRIYELGGNLPNDLKAFHDQAGCVAAKLPDPPTGGEHSHASARIRAVRHPQLERGLRHDLREGSADLRSGRAYSEQGDRARGLVYRITGTRTRRKVDSLGTLPARRARRSALQQESGFYNP
jgi:hypothetical protein